VGARETKRERSRASNKSDDEAVTAAALQRVLGSMKRGRGLRPGFWHVDLDKGPRGGRDIAFETSILERSLLRRQLWDVDFEMSILGLRF